jgi:glycosyltransferase involved in cell wall biosynthesis
MISVVHVISGLEVGGAEIMLANLVSRSNPKRFRHVVVSLTTLGEIGPQIEAAGIRVEALGLARGRGLNLGGFFRLVRLLRRERPDLVQTWLYHGDLVGTVAALLARVPRIVWDVQCSSLEDRSAVLKVIMRLLALGSRIPKAIIVNSVAGQDVHRRNGYKPPAWVWIPNGVDTQAFTPHRAARDDLRQAIGVPHDSYAIGLIARFHPMKDHRGFFEAARILASRRREAIFVLAGAGTEANRAIDAMIAAEGLAGRVISLGTRHDMSSIYPALDMVTLSSAYGEGCPNVLLEAMACGVPCVATDVGDCARIIGDSGEVVPPREPAALADAWERLAGKDPAQLGAVARSRVEALFALDQGLGQYEALYTGLVRDGAVPPSLAAI